VKTKLTSTYQPSATTYAHHVCTINIRRCARACSRFFSSTGITPAAFCSGVAPRNHGNIASLHRCASSTQPICGFPPRVRGFVRLLERGCTSFSALRFAACAGARCAAASALTRSAGASPALDRAARRMGSRRSIGSRCGVRHQQRGSRRVASISSAKSGGRAEGKSAALRQVFVSLPVLDAHS